MKMMYGGVPIKTVKIKHFEMDTNDCTMEPSDLQAGITGVSKGRKIVGTGKAFEFARYGSVYTNVTTAIPTDINIIEVASLDYPVQLSIALNKMFNVDFSIPQHIGNVVIDGQSYPLTITASNNTMTISCDKTIKLQIFYGRDNYA